MAYKNPPHAVLLSIGRELLRGKTRDADGPYLARKLSSLGIEVRRILVIDDVEDVIGETVLEALRKKPDFLFTTGGLGPTFDDMTLRSVARALGRRLSLHREALAMVREYYREMARLRVVGSPQLNPERKKMAILPARSRALPNPCGAAPGVEMQEGKTTIFCLPGVPPEMRGIFRGSIEPRLRALSKHGGEEDVILRTKDESLLVPIVAKLRRRFPQVYVKSSVQGAKRGIRIVVTLHGPSGRRVAAAARQFRELVSHLL